MSLLTFIVLFSTSAFAEPAMTVWSAGYYEHLRARLHGQNVQFMDQRTLAADERAEGYLNPDRRDAVFKKLGLESALKSYDDLDKDMLVMGVRDSSPAELAQMRTKYKTLTLKQLTQLRAAVRTAK